MTLRVILVGLVVFGWGCRREDSPPPEGPPPRLERADESAAVPAETFLAALSRVVRHGGDSIRLEAGDVDDGRIETLACVERLRIVRITGGRLTRRAGAALASMPHLEQLHLRDVEWDDEGLNALATSDSLWLLNLTGRGFTASGLASLGALPRLRQLRLGWLDGDDAVAEAITGMEGLRSVHLIGVAISDRGVMLLAGLPNLQSLYLDDSAVTDAGWEQLLQLHPHLHVHIDQAHHDRDPGRHDHGQPRGRAEPQP